MADPENRLFCRLDSLTQAAREQQRFKALVELDLLKAETVPAFEEATQTSARFLEAPISILSLMTQDRQWIKSAVGLSRAGLMNELMASRQLPRSESFCTYVVDSHQVLAIEDTATDLFFSRSLLFQHYGIRAYLGVPLLTASGDCLGTLAVMDLVPRTFTTKDIDFLVLMARWTLSEVERNYLLKAQRKPSAYIIPKSTLQVQNGHLPNQLSTQVVKVKLLAQLSEELRTPLTSVMGMTSVLNREIYGPLSGKQKEYLEIIYHSGQRLVSLVDEILALGALDENSQTLHLTSVDVEMLCQQAIKSLEQVAHQRRQQIKLSVESGNRIWLLDKDKVRQILYYLIFSVIQSGEAGGVVRILVSRHGERLNIELWLSPPWLENCLPQAELYFQSAINGIFNGSERLLSLSNSASNEQLPVSSRLPASQPLSSSSVSAALGTVEGLAKTSSGGNNSRESLGLLLCCYLAEIHSGEISVQGSSELGYRYLVSFPQLAADERH
ncbi:MAG: GAF domain-containing sensor histidine kinase [Aphanothece sp. CMT-3BRIN-NPC111]|jgi:signal transduction histidine kinase|nr:GAF domain-containing sensor histidine kinase [Aphanothece sp. CMT-3BRIN-NPC111]